MREREKKKKEDLPYETHQAERRESVLEEVMLNFDEDPVCVLGTDLGKGKDGRSCIIRRHPPVLFHAWLPFGPKVYLSFRTLLGGRKKKEKAPDDATTLDDINSYSPMIIGPFVS